ncbi:Pentatricopeptide repeat-containing protein [Acorus calamus]|uniref:Pentatricopeptide repeat-containing protein n=1 Tax=Acorus calamus TaxID=4465 RepID=A0AAV9DUL3_ACOCL|nr:Pentatricopeptide repeat-containing protein [Acorus calamus]
MIHGLAQNGRGDEAHQLFDEMVFMRREFDHISFVGVLCACNQSGQVKSERNYFRSMREDYKIERGLKHYNCMVGLLVRVGMIDEAEEQINGVGQWEEAMKVRVLMVHRGIMKTLGRSWIEVMKGGGCNLVRVEKKMFEDTDCHVDQSYVEVFYFTRFHGVDKGTEPLVSLTIYLDTRTIRERRMCVITKYLECGFERLFVEMMEYGF